MNPFEYIGNTSPSRVAQSEMKKRHKLVTVEELCTENPGIIEFDSSHYQVDLVEEELFTELDYDSISTAACNDLVLQRGAVDENIVSVLWLITTNGNPILYTEDATTEEELARNELPLSKGDVFFLHRKTPHGLKYTEGFPYLYSKFMVVDFDLNNVSISEIRNHFIHNGVR